MGLIKVEKFSEEQNEMALFAKALAHPARIAILQHLATQNSCFCGDFVDHIDLAQATISQHLKELKNMNLIKGTVEGTSVCYCINPTGWAKMTAILLPLLNNHFSNTVCC